MELDDYEDGLVEEELVVEDENVESFVAGEKQQQQQPGMAAHLAASQEDEERAEAANRTAFRVLCSKQMRAAQAQAMQEKMVRLWQRRVAVALASEQAESLQQEAIKQAKAEKTAHRLRCLQEKRTAQAQAKERLAARLQRMRQQRRCAAPAQQAQ